MAIKQPAAWPETNVGQEIADLKSAVAGLSARLAAAETAIATLKGDAPPQKVPPERRPDGGLRIITGDAELRAEGLAVRRPFQMPSEPELRALQRKVLAKYPELKRQPTPGLSDQTLEAEEFDGFSAAFCGIAALYRTPKIDERRDARSWLEGTEDWYRRNGGGAHMSTQEYIAAAIAHGDVTVLLKTPLYATWMSLSAHAGREATDGWRHPPGTFGTTVTREHGPQVYREGDPGSAPQIKSW